MIYSIRQEIQSIYNDRLCYLQIECKWLNIVLINRYAPSEERGDQIKEKFYSDLGMIYEDIPNRIPKIVMRGINAKIGKESFF